MWTLTTIINKATGMTYPCVLDAAYPVADVADVAARDEGVGLEADHDPTLAVYHATLVDQTAPHLVDVRQDSLVLGRTAHTHTMVYSVLLGTMYGNNRSFLESPSTAQGRQTALHLVDVRQNSSSWDALHIMVYSLLLGTTYDENKEDF